MPFPVPHRAALLAALSLSLIAPAAPARAQSSNPDISVIGQPSARWTDDAADPGRRRVRLDAGETEFLFDAPLNPYARGTFIASMGEDGAAIEEAFFSMTRGLPFGLALKGGKYRAGFGRLNPLHPHTYPFAGRFRVLAEYLPGDEAFNETGVQLSEQLALSDRVALTASADWLQGDSFRAPRPASGAGNDPLASGGDDRAGEPRPAALGRLASFVQVGERSGVELGASFARGTNNVAARTRTTLAGADVKAKLWNSPTSYLLLQGELVALDREDAGWNEAAAAYARTRAKPSGFYAYADYAFRQRYDAGVSFERWQPAGGGPGRHHAIGAFAGLALMEETTVFRVGVERLQPAAPPGGPEPDAVHTISFRVVYSMGPHKAHQF
jgi:hypothetical protein